MRNRLLKFALAGCVSVLAGGPALADASWPSKPIRFAIPLAPGTGVDVLARAFADSLSKELNQTIVVENKPGANGMIAVNYFMQQPADGYTMFMAGVSNMAWFYFLYNSLPYDSLKDFEGVAVFADTPFISVVSPTLGVKTFAEFRSLVQKSPDKYSFASAGIGNSTHLASELILKRTGMKMVHVPFNGAAGSTSVIAGDTALYTTVPGGISPLIKSGKVIAVAVTGNERLKAFPDVPTYKELGYEVVVPGWYSIVMKMGTDKQIITKMNAAINRVLKSPQMQERLEAQSLVAVESTPEDVQKLTKRDSAIWAPIINELGIKQ